MICLFVYVQPKDQSFVFPELFKSKKEEMDKQSMDEAKKDLQDYVDSNKAPGLPTWFRM